MIHYKIASRIRREIKYSRKGKEQEMTANATFKVGDRVNVDKQPDVPVVALRCAMCAAAAGIEVEKLSAVPTPETRVWVPAFLKRWIPRWEREKYISLEEAIEREPA
ncbi:MAG: hypothetical protein WDZ67_01395, partial [Patescibacteria group bacterium]